MKMQMYEIEKVYEEMEEIALDMDKYLEDGTPRRRAITVDFGAGGTIHREIIGYGGFPQGMSIAQAIDEYALELPNGNMLMRDVEDGSFIMYHMETGRLKWKHPDAAKWQNMLDGYTLMIGMY